MWNEERMELLRELWALGHPASHIALQLGNVTRNAVLGKAHRMGLMGRIDGPKRPRGGKTQTKAQAHRNRGLTPFGLPPPKAKTKPTEPAPVRVREDIPLPVARVSWDDLDTHHCRWPVGEVGDESFGFCGQPKVVGHSYCADCAERAKPKPRTEPSQPFVIRHRRWALEPA